MHKQSDRKYVYASLFEDHATIDMRLNICQSSFAENERQIQKTVFSSLALNAAVNTESTAFQFLNN